MHNCFVCESLYQVYNVIRMVEDPYFRSCTNDCFIGEVFKGALTVAERLNHLGIFNNVYTYKYNKRRSYNFVKKIENVAEIMFPRFFLRHYFRFQDKDISRYDQVYVSTISPFASCLVLSKDIKKVSYYEDGTSSYRNANGISTFSTFRRMIYKVPRDRLSRFYPVSIHLYSPEMVIVSLNTKYVKIYDRISDDTVKKLVYVFTGEKSYKNDEIIRKNQIIWLTQPDGYSDGKNINSKIYDLLKPHLDVTAIKTHPRDSYSYDYGEICSKECMWELETYFSRIEDKVLVAYYSTALFTPKLLYDKEPILIFLYKLDDLFDRKLNELVMKFSTLYKEKNRIIIVNNEQELSEVLCNLNKRHLKNDEVNELL